jgi:hypothetical protein
MRFLEQGAVHELLLEVSGVDWTARMAEKVLARFCKRFGRERFRLG